MLTFHVFKGRSNHSIYHSAARGDGRVAAAAAAVLGGVVAAASRNRWIRAKNRGAVPKKVIKSNSSP